MLSTCLCPYVQALLQSIPKHKGNVIVGTSFEGRMLEWVRDSRNQKKTPFLAELAFHW